MASALDAYGAEGGKGIATLIDLTPKCAAEV